MCARGAADSAQRRLLSRQGISAPSYHHGASLVSKTRQWGPAPQDRAADRSHSTSEEDPEML